MTNPRRPLPGLLALVLSVACLSNAVSGQTTDPAPTGPSQLATDASISTAFADKDYDRALSLLESMEKRRPKDPFLTYNTACALAMLRREDAAAEKLIDAVSYGFADFHHAERDPHLAPIRASPKYQLLIRGWREVLDARGAAELGAAKDALGQLYASEQDAQLRLSVISAIDPISRTEAVAEMRRVAAWADTIVFTNTTGARAAESRPDPWVLLILPTPQDFRRLVSVGGVGGYYDRDARRLVAQDIGPSLRHEFFHVLHWRHADRLGQRHPLWIMEGLASLLEDVEQTDDGSYTLLPSWRTNIAKRLERAGRLTPWSRLFTMPRDGFMGDRSRANYAQARVVFMFLHDRGALARWYKLYVESYAEDPTGARAIELAMAEPLVEIERSFRLWVRDLPEAAEIGRPGQAGLGFEVGPGAGDGVVILETVAASHARVVGAERLQRRDVITSIDGKSTRTLDDLYRILGELEVGARVTIEFRRGARRLKTEVELAPAALERERPPF